MVRQVYSERFLRSRSGCRPDSQPASFGQTSQARQSVSHSFFQLASAVVPPMRATDRQTADSPVSLFKAVQASFCSGSQTDNQPVSD